MPPASWGSPTLLLQQYDTWVRLGLVCRSVVALRSRRALPSSTRSHAHPLQKSYRTQSHSRNIPSNIYSVSTSCHPWTGQNYVPLPHRTSRSLTVTSSTSAATEVVSQGPGLGGLRSKISVAEGKVRELFAIADVSTMKAKIAALEDDAADEAIWADTTKAKAIMSKLNQLKSDVAELESFKAMLEEARFAVELIEAEADASSQEQSSIIKEALDTLDNLTSKLERWELQRLLSGPYDELGARVTLTAGAGGVDAMDWTEMLERMYLRWCERNGFETAIVERQAGEEAGLKTVEMEVLGRNAYGYLKGEKGTHRLVRNSPFNAKGLRQTSFAGVEVIPILDDLEASLELKPADLEFNYFRSGGAGGQNVNKVETGVRIVHTPSGITVRCTIHRTQEQNRATALQMLKAKLLVILEEQRLQQINEIRGDAVKAEWGQQIRNYVLHPYKLVKDTRTGMETSDVASVLDGHLDDFLAAYLKQQGKQAAQADLHSDMT